MNTWSKGAFLLTGRSPMGFKGITPESTAAPILLRGFSTAGLAIVHLTWQDIGVPDASGAIGLAPIIDSPFHPATDGLGEQIPIAVIEVSDTTEACNMRFRVFEVSRIRLSGLLFSLVWEGDLPTDCAVKTLLLACESSGETLYRMSEESAQASNLLPDIELELKYTLLTDTSPWRVANLMSRALQAGDLTDFCADIGNEIQRWTYDQYTYAAYQDGVSTGYVAFMRGRSGTYYVKFKLFEQDQLRRRETFDLDVDLDPDEFMLYLRRRMPDHTFIALPELVRSRFDVNVLSQRTGHFYGLETDEIHAGGETMRQLEIEYHRTQLWIHPEEDTIEPELDRLALLVEGLLDQNEIRYNRGYKSKLTWLRELQESSHE